MVPMILIITGYARDMALSGGVNNVYNDFKTKNLPPRDKL